MAFDSRTCRSVVPVRRVALGALAASTMVMGTVDPAAADLSIGDLVQPWVKDDRAVVGGYVQGSLPNAAISHMEWVGRRSSWTGDRDEYKWSMGEHRIGHWQKRGQCATNGTYDRKSQFRFTGWVPVGTSIEGGEFGATFNGPANVTASYTGMESRITCHGDGVQVLFN